jgi:hypothetical protein
VILWVIASTVLAGAPETDRVAGAPLVLSEQVLLQRVMGEPAWSADRSMVVIARATDQGSELVLLRKSAGAWSDPLVLVHEHNPDRPALSPDSRRVAYVAGPTAALWLLDLDTSRRTQLTNLNSQHLPGLPPENWVPVPHQAPPRFQGNQLVWDAPDGSHSVMIP